MVSVGQSCEMKHFTPLYVPSLMNHSGMSKVEFWMVVLTNIILILTIVHLSLAIIEKIKNLKD
ncbi:hypothetical protein BAU15_03535 [Enterococcus sp. JM4C]|nr:hypothetical protein BAU15_03535 [Enterococcus sp. JM4C]